MKTYTCKSYKIYWLCLLLFAFSSCSFLDEEPRSQQPAETLITNANSLYINAVCALYSHIGGDKDGNGLQGTYRGIYDLQTFTTDEAIIPTRGGDWYDGGVWLQLFLHLWTSENEIIENAWSYLYENIVLCNRSLEMIDKKRDLLTEDEYLEYRSEVRALRAIYYYYLIDLFGNVPIVTRTDIAMKDIGQSSRSELFRFIETELCESMPNLTIERSNKPGPYYSHVNLPVASFVMMKMALNAEIWLDDNHTDGVYLDGKNLRIRCGNDSLNCWEAVEYYAININTSGHDLDETQDLCFDVHNENSMENIFIIPLDKQLYNTRFCNQFRSLHYQHAAALGYGGENGSCATTETLRTFGYHTPNPDPRLVHDFFVDTVYVNGHSLTLSNGETLVYQGDSVRPYLTGSSCMATAGARMYKYAIDLSGIFDGTLRQNDIVLFRYADVLLSVAEAKVRNGQSGQLQFDKVRNRQAIYDLFENNTPRTANLDNIYEERKLELVWEGWRRQDAIRFRRFTQAYDFRPSVAGEDNGYTTLFPIPQSICDMNPQFHQNKGYEEYRREQ